jgi:hypothetical protein
MKRRDAGFLILGLGAGLLLGMIVISSGVLPDSLFGTAGMATPAQPSYFLVDMAEAQTWLLGTYPDNAESLSSAFANSSQLTITDDFAQTVRDSQDDINLLVDSSFTALTGSLPVASLGPTPSADTTLPAALIQSLTDGDISSCLGLDENPYNVDGYALYFYIEVPETQVQYLPESWGEPLGEPMDDSLFWQRLACQTLSTGASGGSR